MKHTNIFKKMLAAFSAAAVAASCVSFTAFAEGETTEVTEYTAFLSMQSGADQYWAADDEGVTPVTFTEDGTYTVSVESLTGSDSIELLLLSTNINLYGYVPEGYETVDAATLIADAGINITIDSLQLTHCAYDENGGLIDGETVDISYTDCGADSLNIENDGVSLRKNIYNVWQSPNVSDIASTGYAMNAGDYITATFTVTGIGSSSEENPDEGTDTPSDTPVEDGYTVFLSMQSGADQYWAADDEGVTPVTFTEDGTYTVSVESLTGSDSIELLLLSTNINLYNFVPEDYETVDAATLIADSGLNITIDSIQLTHCAYDENGGLIDGETVDIAYTDCGADSLNIENDGVSLRKNIYNVWQSPNVSDIASTGYAMNAGDYITVTFTVTGLGDSPFSEVSYGDVNGDGVIAISDATAILTEYASSAAGLGSTLDDAQKVAADVDGDGSIAIADATAVLSYYANDAAGMNPDINEFFPAAAQ